MLGEISRNIGCIADSLSFVITTGGLGLFFEPGGLPRGLRPDEEDEEAPMPTITC